jgi:apolipoprotein N-acyltransferase
LKKKLFTEIIFLGFIGMLSSLSLTPFNFFIINFFTFSSLYLFLSKKLEQKKNTKIFFLYGWAFGFGYFVTNLYWISISLTFDQSFKFLIPFTFILIPCSLAVF